MEPRTFRSGAFFLNNPPATSPEERTLSPRSRRNQGLQDRDANEFTRALEAPDKTEFLDRPFSAPFRATARPEVIRRIVCGAPRGTRCPRRRLVRTGWRGRS